MKSPWKFIGQLISGRKGPDLLKGPAEDAAKPSEIVQDTQNTAQPPAVTASQPADGSSSASMAKENAALEVETRRSDGNLGAVDAVDVVPAIKSDPASSEKGRETGAQQARRGRRPRQSAPGKRAAIGAVTPKTPVPARNLRPLEEQSVKFEGEIIGIDAEVRALRRQLVEKLRQQNVQLRQMLERFGGL